MYVTLEGFYFISAIEEKKRNRERERERENPDR